MYPTDNYLYYFVALGLLLLPPLILSIKKEFIKSVIYTSFIFTVLSLTFQFFRIFSGLLVFLSSVSVTILILFFSDNDAKKIGKNQIFIFLIVLLASIFFFSYSLIPPDTWRAYLPWSRILTVEKTIPAFHLETNKYYGIYYPPLLYSYVAYLFSLTGKFYISIAHSVTIFFSASTFLLLLKFKKKKEIISVASFLLFFNNIFFRTNSSVLQEIPLLFFTTCAFYYFFEYLENKNKEDFILLAISCSLCSLTKYSGIIISLIFFCWILYKRMNKNLVLIFILFQIPIALWMLRNYYYYENPVFPLLNKYIGGKFYFKPIERKVWSEIPTAVNRAVMNLIKSLPLFFFAFINIFRNFKKFEKKMVFVTFLIFLILLLIVFYPNVRYLFPFYGILALYAGEEIYNLLKKVIDPVFKKINFRVGGVILIILLSIGIALKDKSYKNDEFEVLDLIEKNSMIFGVQSPILIWYGECTVLGYDDRSFLILNNGYMIDDYSILKEFDYVYDNSNADYITKEKHEKFEEIFAKIEKDPDFKLIYNKNGIRVWRVICSKHIGAIPKDLYRKRENGETWR